MGLRILARFQKSSKLSTEPRTLSNEILNLWTDLSHHLSPRNLILSTNYLPLSIRKCFFHSLVPLFLILLLLLIQKIYHHPLYLLVPVIILLVLFCLSARIRKHWVTKRRLKVSALEEMMEGTHKRIDSHSELIQSTRHSSQLPSQKLSDNTIASNDSLTNGLVMRAARKSSPTKPETHEGDQVIRPFPKHPAQEMFLQELSTEEGCVGHLRKKGSGKIDVEITMTSPRMSEEIRVHSPTSRGGVNVTTVAPLGYGSRTIKLGSSKGGSPSPSLSMMSESQSNLGAGASDEIMKFESDSSHHKSDTHHEPDISLASYELGISGKSIEYTLPADTRLRTSSELESQIMNPPPLALVPKRERPNYRGAFSVHEADDEEDESKTNTASPVVMTSRQRKLIPRKFSKKMSGTVKRIFSRVISKQFSLAPGGGGEESNSDGESDSDFSDSRFSFDSDDEEGEEYGSLGEGEDELGVISIDQKITQSSRSRKNQFPTSP
jgi:hypothetical protein